MKISIKDFSGCFALTENRVCEMDVGVVSDTYTWGFPDYETGLDHLREIIRETVNERMEGLSEEEVDIDGTLDQILESGEENEMWGRWTWRDGETEFIWELGRFCVVPD